MVLNKQEVVRITKINDEYEFEYFANREEARKKYGEDVETIGIGEVINCFKRGKSNSGKDLTAEQIEWVKKYWFEGCTRKRKRPYNFAQKF